MAEIKHSTACHGYTPHVVNTSIDMIYIYPNIRIGTKVGSKNAPSPSMSYYLEVYNSRIVVPGTDLLPI